MSDLCAIHPGYGKDCDLCKAAKASTSAEVTLLKCHICEQPRMRSYTKPIDYSVCARCGHVFVLGKDGTVSVLDFVKAV